MNIAKNISIIIILFAGLVSCQYFYDKSRSRSPLPSPFVLNSDVAKTADLGLDSAASSFFWLSSIQYFGGSQTDNYQKMDEYINLVTDLDPKFSHPYAFATLTMPAIDLTDEAIKIGKKGIEKAEPNWEIPYNLALVYHMDKSDTANAAKYFDVAANTPGAPDNVKWIATNYGSRPDTREQIILIWQGIAKNTNDEVLRQRANAYIFHYQLMTYLEEAAKIYQQKYGSYPDPIEKLVETKIIPVIPQDPFNSAFKFDTNGRIRNEFKKK